MTRLLRYRHAGFTFDVTDQGPLDGDPVVLLHGWPERASSWRKLTPILHEAGLRTYAPDQRGYSRGARPPRRRDYALQHLVGDAVALIEHEQVAADDVPAGDPHPHAIPDDERARRGQIAQPFEHAFGARLLHDRHGGGEAGEGEQIGRASCRERVCLVV